MSFSFSFSGDDIEEAEGGVALPKVGSEQREPGAAAPSQASAFPVEGKPQLAPVRHDLDDLLAMLPSKVAYDVLEVKLDDGRIVSLPRRELWDVRLQLMAEDDGSGATTEGLGNHDVKTGVYEGGFKSWESSVDLVKVLATQGHSPGGDGRALRVMEVGCKGHRPPVHLFLDVEDGANNNP